MSKTLLLLKLLQGEDVRSCSLLSRQHVYATLQLNHEVEVRSTTAMRAGPRPEFNQLFMLELGPWWKGKDVVLQLFSKNRLRKDSFLGGCSCKLGELVRAVGLDDSHNSSGEGGSGGGGSGGGGAYGGGASLAELGSAGVGSFATSSASPSPSPSPLTPGGGAFDASLAPTPGLVCFQRVSAEEVRRFGELLPVLPGTGSGADDDGHGAEGVEQSQPGAAREGEDDAAASSASGESVSASASSPATGSSARRLRARSVAPAALPCTWLILRHGGGPAALRQFPPPQWHLPAGRLAIYLDFIVLPPSSIPKMMSAPGQRSGMMSGSATPLLGGSSAAAAAAAERERRQLVCLPSTILPNGWLGMSDNEKLAWAHAHRRARAAPVPQPMGGLVAFVARGLLGAGGGAGGGGVGASSGSATPLSSVASPGVGGVPGNNSSVPSNWPFPWSVLLSTYSTLLSSNVQDRVFYAWYAVLGLAVLATELLFTRPTVHDFGGDVLPFLNEGGATADAVTAAAAASAPAAAVESDKDWFPLPSGALLWSLVMGVAILKFGWNMLNDHQISHPWRRLDLVLTLLLGLGLGAAAQIAAAGTAATRVLGMLALACTHGYARATLYQNEVVAGVLEEQFRPVVACGGGREARLRHVEPLDQKAAVLRWTAASLADTYTTGAAWVTGKAARAALAAGGPAAAASAAGHRAAIPGSIQLCLRSCFFLVGQVCAQWVLLPAPALLRWWLSALTWPQMMGFVLPLFLFLLLFMFGKDSAALRGRPWLLLFGLNSLLLLYAALRFLPVLGGLIFTALLHTLWSHKWSLLSLPLEWALSAAFVPAHVWHAAHLQARVNHAMHLPSQHAQVQSPIKPLHINMNYMQQQQDNRPEGRRSGSATPARQ